VSGRERLDSDQLSAPDLFERERGEMIGHVRVVCGMNGACGIQQRLGVVDAGLHRCDGLFVDLARTHRAHYCSVAPHYWLAALGLRSQDRKLASVLCPT
jgi:hypothetical protein